MIIHNGSTSIIVLADLKGIGATQKGVTIWPSQNVTIHSTDASDSIDLQAQITAGNITITNYSDSDVLGPLAFSGALSGTSGTSGTSGASGKSGATGASGASGKAA